VTPFVILQEFIRRFNPDAPVSPATTSVAVGETGETGETGPDAEADADAYEYDDDAGLEEDDDSYFGDVTRVVDKQPRREKRDLGTLTDVETVPGHGVDPSGPRLLPQHRGGRTRSRAHQQESAPLEVQQRRPAPRGPGRGVPKEVPSILTGIIYAQCFSVQNFSVLQYAFPDIHIQSTIGDFKSFQRLKSFQGSSSKGSKFFRRFEVLPETAETQSPFGDLKSFRKLKVLSEI